MTFEIRPITNEEFVPFTTQLSSAFGHAPNSEITEAFRSAFEFDRSLAAFDGARIVATAGIDSFELTLPGLTRVPAAGVTAVTVAPTHRRRGILTSMMRQQLKDVRERGEPLAMLLASESIIYGRYGYGMATHQVELEAQRGYGDFGRHPEITGSVEPVDKEEASKVIPKVYDAVRRQHPGCINRSDKWWEITLKDFEPWRDGHSDRRYVVYRSGKGKLEGYVAYRMKMNWEDGGFPNGKLRVTDFLSANSEARAALWRFCLGVDLIGTVTVDNAPIDDPLRWMVADPRRLRVKSTMDFLWVRLVDIPAALSARRYSTEETLVLEVEDPFCPDNSGRYVLQGGADGATCKRARSRPDLSLQITDLGAVYLGGAAFSTLARAGRVVENRKGSLRRADLMFSSDPQPWCSTGF
jgi:predicted acetyltransferase